MAASPLFYDVDEVMALTGWAKAKAYKLIKELNEELESEGFITRPGWVPKKRFQERCYCDENTDQVLKKIRKGA